MCQSIIFYVSTHGRKGWSGRLPEPNADKTDGPFCSVGEAQAAIRSLPDRTASITVLLRGGTYWLDKPITFRPEDSGTSQFPITYAAYPGEIPVLSGGIHITGWLETTFNGLRAWVANAPCFGFQELWVNNQRRYRPRLPKDGFYSIKGIPSENIAHDSLSGDREFYVEPGQMLNWENLSDTEIVALTLWVESRLPVESVDEASGLVKTRLKSALTLAKGAPFYVENVFPSLNEPGLWYHHRKEGKLYYLPLSEESLDTTTIIVPRISNALLLHGNPERKHYIEFLHFNGLCISHTEWQRSDTTATMRFKMHDDGESRQVDVFHVADDVAGDAQAAVSVAGTIEARFIRHCRFDHCIIAHAGNYGLELGLGCHFNEISYCEFHDLGAGGVKLGTQSALDASVSGANRVANCHIHNAGLIHHSAVGIWLGQTGNNTIEQNHIHDLHYTGISVGWTWGYGESGARNNIIAYNHIHDIGQGLLSDMGGIYTLGSQPGTVIRGNRIHGMRKSIYGALCIYLDEGSSHILVEENICYDTNGEVFHLHYGQENTLRRNIFAFGAEGILGHGRVLGKHLALTFEGNILLTDRQPIFTGGYACLLSQRNHQSDHNIIWDISDSAPFFKDKGGVVYLPEWQLLGHDIHAVVADPKFHDPTRGDFTLAEDSPAIGLSFHSSSDYGILKQFM